MKLLRSKRVWKNWATKNGLLNQDGPAKEPTEYPCFAYTSCRSFGYEELNEHYIYYTDLSRMKAELLTATGDLRIHCEHCKKVQRHLSSYEKCDAQIRIIKYTPAGI